MPLSINLPTLPTRKVEAWKYTSVKKILAPEMKLVTDEFDIKAVAERVAQLRTEWNGAILVSVNGRVQTTLSDYQYFNLVTAPQASAQMQHTFLNQVIESAQTPEQTIQFKDLDRAVLFLHFVAPTQAQSLVTGRLKFEFVGGANVEIIHQFVSLREAAESAAIFEVTESLHSGAKVESVFLRDASFGLPFFLDHQVEQSNSSELRSAYFHTGGDFSRFELKAQSSASSTHTELLGLYLLKNNEHADFHTHLDHLAPESSSNQLYRGVLSDTSVGVFRGKIHIHEQCPQTHTAQLNQNILLSPKSEIDTLPQLQIDTDDVKATHGATVGRLQEEELFYLQSRAIDKVTAQRMLVTGFANDIALKIHNYSIRERVLQSIQTWIEQLGGSRA